MEIDAVIVMTHADPSGVAILPHMEALKRSNPGIPIYTCVSQESPIESAWKNCDRTLRNFWTLHRQEIQGEAIAVIEWDVLVTQNLPPLSGDFQAKNVLHNLESGWTWWREVDRLNGLPAYGAAPFAFTLWSRRALDFIIEAQWDELYARDIFCELRTPSILATSFQLLPMDLPNVDWKQCSVSTAPGIYHPVKHPHDQPLKATEMTTSGSSTTAIKPLAFYHVAGMNHWREVVTEQLGILSRARFPGKIHCGFLGAQWEDGFIANVARAAGLDVEIRHLGGDFGQYEFPTLQWMQAECQKLDPNTPVLYFHGKGVSRHSWETTMWRWLMNAYNLADWKTMSESVGAEFNCAGVSWVPSGYPAAYIPGNFWWSTAGHVSHLTPITEYVTQFVNCLAKCNPHKFQKRHAAEMWFNSRLDANTRIFGPQRSQLWSRGWWTDPANDDYVEIAYRKGSGIRV